MTCTWIAVDWGTSRLRAWAMRGDEVLDEASSGQGMATLAPEAFEAALLACVEPWLTSTPLKVIACGMVGARQGWVEAPYASVPTTPVAPQLIPAPTEDPRLDVWIAPGLKQVAPPDVMRGEETQIAGFLAGHAGYDGVICLPGTHTKWVRVRGGQVLDFRTFMTGEMFALLSGASVLRHDTNGQDWDDASFLDGVDTTLSSPESLAGELFAIRASSLLATSAPASARARLSGLLLGAELAGARSYWQGQNVAVIGTEGLSGRYVAALQSMGVSATVAQGEKMVLLGLSAARRSMEEPAA